jgi:hypothetical protein
MALLFLKVVPSPTLRPDRSSSDSSQTTSNNGSIFRMSSNAILQDPASGDDLSVIPFNSSDDEDDSNGQLRKQNLFQNLEHNASSLSIKSVNSSRAQSDSSSPVRISSLPNLVTPLVSTEVPGACREVIHGKRDKHQTRSSRLIQSAMILHGLVFLKSSSSSNS